MGANKISQLTKFITKKKTNTSKNNIIITNQFKAF